jgi:MFS family permease
LTATAQGRPPRAARFAVALCFILSGALFASWVTRIPAVETALGMSHATLGLVLLASSFGALLAMPLTGVCISRFGSRATTQVAVVLYAVSLPGLALAQSPVQLAIALFVLGAFYGGLDVAMNAQAVAVERAYGRPIMGSFHALFSLGGLAGAAAGGLVVEAGISPLRHFTGAVLTVGLFTVVVAVPRLLAGEPKAAECTARRNGFRLPPSSLLVIGVIAFCAMMSEGSVADWGAIFLHREIGTAAGGFAAFSITMALARFFGDHFAARLGTVRLVRLGGSIAAAGLALALAVGHTALALVGFAAMGLGLAPIIPLIFSAAGRTPGMEAGPALAVTTTIGYSGFLLGPPLIGFIAQAYGLRPALGIIVAMCLAVALLARFAEPKEAAK